MVDRPANVRLAGPADEDAVYALLRGLETDNGLGLVEHDEATVREAIRLGTEQRGGFVAIIDSPDRPGEVVASMGVHITTFWYNRNVPYLAEIWLYVDPAYRKGTGYADDLVHFAQWLRDTFNSASPRPVAFFTSVSSRKRLVAKARWWARRGEHIGSIFLLR